MKHRRSSVGRTRLILILLCIVLAAAMLWCALSLILRVGTYSGRTVGKDPVQEQTPVEPVDLEPTVPENSYDPAGFYEEGGFKRYKSEDTLASVGVDLSTSFSKPICAILPSRTMMVSPGMMPLLISPLMILSMDLMIRSFIVK